MDRLTKYSKETTHENGVCCTHFGGMECFACNGDCSRGCTWEEAAWSRLAAYEDTGLTPERCAEFARADAEGRYIVMRDAEQEGVARLRELAEADKDGRCVVLPCNGYSDIEIVRNGISYKPAHWDIHLTTFAHGQNTPSGIKVGLFDIGEVERALREIQGKEDADGATDKPE